ncbi:MAG: phosphotransferase [Actinobacteria bacterium]|nr:phosphotransferase [Actinomycetota bacterium]
MTLHDLSGGADVLDRVTAVARAALAGYGWSAASTIELINVSENATFRVTGAHGGATVLRVHRRRYHSPTAIESELSWLTAVGADTAIRTPRVTPTVDGRRVLRVPDPDGAEDRCCVMFEFLPGAEPSEHSWVADFCALGELTARLHEHAAHWTRPRGFTRFYWDYDAAFGSEARWGRWQHGLGVGPEESAVFTRLDAALKARLAAFGQGPGRFGLIHADLRLANLLVEPGQPTSVIDFDDCGFGWYLYDLGAALSFIEHRPEVPEMIDAWVRGYRRVRALPDEDVEEAWTFVMFRRLLLTAWVGSHPAAADAAHVGAGYTTDGCELAEWYLGRFS